MLGEETKGKRVVTLHQTRELRNPEERGRSLSLDEMME